MESNSSPLNIIEKYWHYILLGLAILYSLIFQTDFFNASVLCSGVLCVALVAKGNIWNYAVGMYNTVAYAYIAFNEHLYGEFGLYILFFIPTNILGYYMWKRRARNHIVTSVALNFRGRMILVLSILALTTCLAYLLRSIPNQNNPFLDAYITVSSVVATLLMLKRYTEQWIVYILLNTVSIVLWLFRYANGSDTALSMIGMFTLFWINACFGWYMWQIKLKEKKE